MRKSWKMLALSATLTMAGPAWAQIPPIDPNLTLLSDPVAVAYADQYGVSEAEARLILALLKEIVALDQELKSTAGDIYGGLYVVHKPNFQVIVQFTEGASARLTALTSNPLFRAVEVEVTVNKLTSDAENVIAQLRRAGIDAEVEVDIDGQSVELRFVDAAALNSAKQGGTVSLPETVRETQVAALAQVTATIIGGRSITATGGGLSGTSGFSVVSSSNVRGILTAGHVDNRASYGSTTLTYQAGLDAGSVDAQWHTAAGSTFPNQIFIGSGNHTITQVYNPYLLPANWTVCKYGVAGGYRCGEVQGNSSGTYNGQASSYIRVRNASGAAMSIQGDSGGPVFGTNTAYGIIHGRGGAGTSFANDLYFMPQQNLQQLNISIATTP